MFATTLTRAVTTTERTRGRMAASTRLGHQLEALLATTTGHKRPDDLDKNPHAATLQASFRPDVSAAQAGSAPPEQYAWQKLRDAQFASAIGSTAAKTALGCGKLAAASSAEEFYCHLRAAVRQTTSTGKEEDLGAIVCVGAACLGEFVQQNLTGPPDADLVSPLQLLAPHLVTAPAAATAGSQSSTAPTSPAKQTDTGKDSSLGDDTAHPHDRWALGQLCLDGEDPIGKVVHPQYLLMAQALLVEPLLTPESINNSSNNSSRSTSNHASSTENPAGASSSPAGIPASAVQLDTAPASSPTPSLAAQQAMCDTALTRVLRLYPSWAWWALRAVTLHQHMLAGRSATLLARVNLLSQQLLPGLKAAAEGAASRDAESPSTGTPSNGSAAVSHSSGHQQQQQSAEGHDGGDFWQAAAAHPPLIACGYIELAMAQYAYGYVEPAEKLLHAAGEVLGLQVELTGALGLRTVYQVDAKAQLVVRATRRRQQPGGDQDVRVDAMGIELPGRKAAAAGDTVKSAAGTAGEGKVPEKETEGLNEEADVLLAPKLVGEEGQELERVYHGAEQALLLGWSTHVRKGTAQDELQGWQMAPYVEAVLAQGRSQPMLQVTARLLKIRHEKNRNRTRERALVHMEQLCDALTAPLPATGAAAGRSVAQEAAARMPYVYCVSVPLHARLRKELAEQYMSLGFVGAALRIFEALEMWDALIVCYRLLEKKSLAEEVVRRRLKVTPNDPLLWCSLGDLHLDDSYYVEGWERSGRRHSRSKRSLGRSALRRKDWAAAAQHYEDALAINPLNHDAWFALGYAYLKINQDQKALKAFTRVTQQQPDNAEAWNNIAALWLNLNRPKEAFSALAQCVKYKRDSWQVWENYGQAALQSGQFAQAAHSVRQVMQLTGGTRMHMETMEGLVQEVERICGIKATTGSSATSATQPATATPDTQPAPDQDGAEAQPSTAGDGAGSATENAAGSDSEVAGEDDTFTFDFPVLELVGMLDDLQVSEAGADGQTSSRSQPNGLVSHGQGASSSSSNNQGEGTTSQAQQSSSTGGGGAATSSTPAASKSKLSQDIAAAEERASEHLKANVGALLKDGANAPCCSPALWGLLGRYYAAVGQLESAKEAVLKQVRGLSGTAYKADQEKFVEMAQASLALGRAYINLASGGANKAAGSSSAQTSASTPPGPSETSARSSQEQGGAQISSPTLAFSPTAGRELAAARMHLRGVIKQCESAFEEHELYKQLQALLDQVVALESEAQAAAGRT